MFRFRYEKHKLESGQAVDFLYVGNLARTYKELNPESRGLILFIFPICSIIVPKCRVVSVDKTDNILSQSYANTIMLKDIIGIWYSTSACSK